MEFDWIQIGKDMSRPARALWIEIRLHHGQITVMVVEAREGLVD